MKLEAYLGMIPHTELTVDDVAIPAGDLVVGVFKPFVGIATFSRVVLAYKGFETRRRAPRALGAIQPPFGRPCRL